MLISERTYLALKGRKAAEIPGPKDHPWIKMAQNLCGIHMNNVDQKSPWCSTGANLEMIGQCLAVNAGKTINYLLKHHGLKSEFIMEICAAYNIQYTLKDNGADLDLPALSAAAKSWKTYGVEVKRGHERKGDILVFERDGGHHITFLDEDKIGRIYSKCRGCNQNNEICTSSKYLTYRLVAIRRSRV